MAPKVHDYAIVLKRDGHNTPWGIRIVGGSDFDTPLIITKVQLGSPAHGELMRGDIITKIQDYDSRDIRHADAQSLFKSAGNTITLVVHRDNSLAVPCNNRSNDNSRCSSTIPPCSPNLLDTYTNGIHRGNSPAIGVNSLPHTVFSHTNDTFRPDSRSSCFSPMPTRDHQQEVLEETTAIVSQPYRTTPLILPGAKVKKDVTPTECYLRHHPNPAMRGPVHHMDDLLMKQKVADSVLHRVVGEDSRSGKVQHKQFNSPIGLYSDSNIENTIRQTVPSSTPYKRTVVYDPSKSETYKALQEDNYGHNVQEIPIPVQQKIYHSNRLVPGKYFY